MVSAHELVISDEFKERVKAFKKDFANKYEEISKEETPRIDGNGNKIVDRRPDGKDYIIEAYMRSRLDQHFPGWSSTAAAPLHFLGAEWVVAQVELSIIDEHLLAFGISPPIRKFYGVDSVRIQYRTCPCRKSNSNIPRPDCQICNGTGSLSHTPENIIDVGDNCQSAVTGALKRAINRLTHIGDDIYGKRVEYEGAGSYETVLQTTGGFSSFTQLLKDHGISPSEAMKLLGIADFKEVDDFAEAWNKIKEAKGIK